MKTSSFQNYIKNSEKDLNFSDLNISLQHKTNRWQTLKIDLAIKKLGSFLSKSKICTCKNSIISAEIIINLKAINQKLRSLIQILDKKNENKNLINSIKKTITSSTKKIIAFKSSFESKQRLPFHSGSIRERIHTQIKDILQLKYQSKANKIQEVFFHLMSSHFDKSIAHDLDVNTYCGNSDVFGLESWKEILSDFIREATCERSQKIGLEILHTIDKSIPISLKMFALSNVFANEELERHRNEIEYFSDYISMKKSKKNDQTRKDLFFDKYQLKSGTKVPQIVLYNEIAWDMLEGVKQLQPGERAIFPIGTINHSILAEVLCITPPNLHSKGNYQWKIFNTGLGARDFHKTRSRDSNAIYPLVYENIPANAFSYAFFNQLIRFSIKGKKIEDVYKHMDNSLTGETKGEISPFQTKPYREQNFGTCSYSCLEAWIESFFNSEEVDLLTNIKINNAILKQTQILDMLDQERSKKFSQSDSIAEVAAKTRIENEAIASTKNRENSLYLLNLSKQILKQRLEQSTRK